jgi:ATP-dependent RNA helicase DDX6/DHH1
MPAALRAEPEDIEAEFNSDAFPNFGNVFSAKDFDADEEQTPAAAANARFQTTDVTATRGQEFEDYFLKRELLMGIFEKGFERPSPVQERSIPIILQNRNVLARAKNGTGKTAAFIIPCLEKTDTAKNWIQVLILVPTRELALQTSSVVRELGKHMSIECMASTGGTSLKDDIMRLYSTVHILVGTPGRILDLASKGVANLTQCKTVIMDEADKLLSPEFEPSLEQFINLTAPARQLCLFSATFPVTVKAFKDKFIQNPYEIDLMDDLTLSASNRALWRPPTTLSASDRAKWRPPTPPRAKPNSWS